MTPNGKHYVQSRSTIGRLGKRYVINGSRREAALLLTR